VKTFLIRTEFYLKTMKRKELVKRMIGLLMLSWKKLEYVLVKIGDEYTCVVNDGYVREELQSGESTYQDIQNIYSRFKREEFNKDFHLKVGMNVVSLEVVLH